MRITGVRYDLCVRVTSRDISCSGKPCRKHTHARRVRFYVCTNRIYAFKSNNSVWIPLRMRVYYDRDLLSYDYLLVETRTRDIKTNFADTYRKRYRIPMSTRSVFKVHGVVASPGSVSIRRRFRKKTKNVLDTFRSTRERPVIGSVCVQRNTRT